ncbi:MAG TPA: glycosyltransferase family 39 protein [Thermoanaerobaculia bacterium]|nr:glycosyltransferase family 39 protein [Thermoanaerobaculia bacterium]
MTRARLAPWLLLLLIAALSVVPRLPFFANAAAGFNSDEAVNALVIKHLVEGKERTFYSWDATYYGLVEGVMALPFVWAQGFTPLAFRLAAFLGFLLLLAVTFLLGRRLFGTAEGLVAAALLAVFSPLAVLWSTMASGGYLLVVAWGTLTLLWLDVVRGLPPERRAGWRWVVLGFLLGFGLYIYELYLVYVAVLAGAALAALLAVRWREVPRLLLAAWWILAGFVIGWAPKLLLLLYGTTGSKKPSYGFAKWEKILANLELFARECAPALFGTNPAGLEEATRWTGRPWPLSEVLGWLVIAVYAAAWLWAAWRVRGQIGGVFRRQPAGLRTEALLVLLVPAVALLFVLSPNPQDVLSNRYLLPWLSSLPVLAGAFLVRIGRRSKIAALAAALLLVGFPAAQAVDVARMAGYLGPGLRIADQPETLEWVLRYLRKEGIRGAYAPYWLSYEATFLSGEQIVVAPLQDWDRYPAYTQTVNGLSRVAYIFERGSGQEATFLARLRESGKRYEARRIGRHAVYTGPGGARLVPVRAPLVPLAQPRCRIVALHPPPTVVSPGETLEIPVRLTNTGPESWSAAGGPIGMYRVTFSYHWLDAKGTMLVFDGERTPLREDVGPGGPVDLEAKVVAPQAPPGEYRLVLAPVQELVAWFDQVGACKLELPVTVSPRSGG